MITTENQKYVETFDDIRGGKLIVDAAVGFLDPLLEVSWSSDNPDIATVDERGRVKGCGREPPRLPLPSGIRKRGKREVPRCW